MTTIGPRTIVYIWYLLGAPVSKATVGLLALGAVVLFVLWNVQTYGANWLSGGPTDHEIMCGKLLDAMDQYRPVSRDARQAVLATTDCF